MHRKFVLVGMLIAALFATMIGNVMAQDDATDTDEDRAFLGINYDLTAERVEVSMVGPDTPAAEAGLQIGDIITAVDGEAVTPQTVAEVIGNYAPGDTIALTVVRDGEEMEVAVELAAQPVNARRQQEREQRREDRPGEFRSGPMIEAAPFLGVSLDETENGLVVLDVVEDSGAEAAGVMVGDILLSIDGTDVTTVEAAREIITSKEIGDDLPFTVERDGETLELSAELTAGSATVTAFPVPFLGDEIVYNEEAEGWEVIELMPESRFAEAGLEVGDLITAINGESYAPGDFEPGFMFEFDMQGMATLTVQRGDETFEVEVEAILLLTLIMDRNQFEIMPPSEFAIPVPDMRGPNQDRFEIVPPGEFAIPLPDMRGPNRDRFEIMPIMPGRPILGVAFQTLDPQIAEAEGVDLTEGALIVDVIEGTPADIAGIQVGDVIVSVDGDIVDVERTLADRLFAYETGDTIELGIVRDGETITLEVILSAVRDRG